MSGELRLVVVLGLGVALGVFLAEWALAKTRIRYQALSAQGS